MADRNIRAAALKAGDVIIVEKVPSEATRSKILAAAKAKIQLIGF